MTGGGGDEEVERAGRRILVLCTANLCRSPMAVALLRPRVAPDVGVTSAGTHAIDAPIPLPVAEALGALGLGLPPHQARPLDAEVLATDGADLVLAMERAHLRACVLVDPAVWRRAFTLRELVRLASPRPRPPGTTLRAWLSELSAWRDPGELFVDDPSEDIADPFGGSPEGFWRTAVDLDDLLARLVRLGRLGPPTGPGG